MSERLLSVPSVPRRAVAHEFFVEALESRIAPAAFISGPGNNNSLESVTHEASPAPLAAAADTQVSLAKTSIMDLVEDSTPPLEFTFTRNGSTTNSLTVNFVVGGTAALGVDYTKSGPGTFTANSGTITFEPGVSSLKVSVSPIRDQIIEGDETVVLTLSPSVDYTIATSAPAVATIVDDDMAIEISLNTLAVPESGSANLLYTLTRSGALRATTQPIIVSGTALMNSDYTLTGAGLLGPGAVLVTFSAGQATATITVDPIGDGDVEADETVSFKLMPSASAIIGSDTIVGTILNDDAQVSVSVAPSSVSEDGTVNLVYTFDRAGFIGAPLTVNFGVSGAATYNTDYSQAGASSFSATSGSVTIPAGSTSAAVTLHPAADNVAEQNESVTLTVTSGTNYAISPANVATGTILEGVATVTLALNPTSVLEDETANLVYTFTRTGATTSPLTVNFGVGGTVLDSDYTQVGADSFANTAGAITFAPGASTATLTIDPKADTSVEADETLTLSLVPGTGYLVGTSGSVTGTIMDDDVLVSVAVAPAAGVNEDGSENLVYTFTRTGTLTAPLTANFGVTGSATHNLDYSSSGATSLTGSSGSVLFPAGASSVTVTVDPTADLDPEADETVVITVASGAGYQPAVTAATGRIIGDDTAVSLAISENFNSVIEGSISALTYTFTRVGSAQAPLSASFSLGGTAILGTDYTVSGAVLTNASGGTVTIPAGALQATVRITTTNDTIVEPEETVTLTLVGAPGYQVTTSQPVVGRITDNDTTVTLSLASDPLPEGNATGRTFILARTPGDSLIDIAVNFNLGGSAVANTDYFVSGAATFNGNAGTVIIPSGSASTTLSVVPIDDTLVEGPESVAVLLASGSGYVVSGAGGAEFAIADNDTATVEFLSATSTLHEGGSRQDVEVALVVTANGVKGVGSLTREVSASLRDLGTGTAKATDYSFVGPTTITFPSGASTSTQHIYFDVAADSEQEGDETIDLQLASVFDSLGRVTLGSPATHTATIVDSRADLNLSATQSSPAVVAGSGAGNLTYTVTLTNDGTADATGVLLDEDLTLVPGANLVSVTPSAGTYQETEGEDGRWTLGLLPGGKSATLTIVITAGSAAASGDILSRSTLTSGEVVADSLLLTTPVARKVDLQVSSTVNGTTTVPGSTLVYTFNVSNTLPSDAHGVVLVDKLPAGTSLDAATSTPGWTDTGSGTFTLNLGSLAGQTSAEPITLAAKVNNSAAAGVNTLENKVSVADDGTAGADPTAANNVAVSSTTLAAEQDLSVEISAAPLRVVRGGLMNYTLAYANSGNQAATGVFIDETLPIGTIFVPNGSSVGWVETASGSGVYRYEVGTLAAADSGTLTFQVRAAQTFPAGTSAITNTVRIQDSGVNGPDRTVANNSDSADTALYQGVFAFSLGGVAPQVKVYDAGTGNLALDFMAYEGTATAGVRVAVGDVNGDGIDDIVTAYGKGTGRVRAFDGSSGAPLSIGGATELNPFSPSSMGGAFVAVGDVTGDGRGDIVVSAGTGGREVKVYDGVTGAVAATFSPFGKAKGGVRVAVSDVNGDGVADIIASQNSGGGQVSAFAGGALPSAGLPDLLFKTKLKGSNGVFVAAANVTGDAKPELILGSGDRSPSKLLVYSPESRTALYESSAFTSAGTRGLRVAAVDLDRDGFSEILAAPGGSRAGEVLILDGDDGTVLPESSRRPFPVADGRGVYIAGSVASGTA